jgi:hypothetical protein
VLTLEEIKRKANVAVGVLTLIAQTTSTEKDDIIADAFRELINDTTVLDKLFSIVQIKTAQRLNAMGVPVE